jgi:ACT domain-containing protein
MREVITKAKIAELPDKAELKVLTGTIFTQAARELIKEKGITLQFLEDEVLTGQQENSTEIGRGIVTVIGRDRVGIIARVAGILSAANVNILDISQTVLQGFFAMVMIVDLSSSTAEFTDLRQQLEDAGDEMCLKITLQHEDIFRYMHRV